MLLGVIVIVYDKNHQPVAKIDVHSTGEVPIAVPPGGSIGVQSVGSTTASGAAAGLSSSTPTRSAIGSASAVAASGYHLEFDGKVWYVQSQTGGIAVKRPSRSRRGSP